MAAGNSDVVNWPEFYAWLVRWIFIHGWRVEARRRGIIFCGCRFYGICSGWQGMGGRECAVGYAAEDMWAEDIWWRMGGGLHRCVV